jgi:hypothetical protein
MDPKVFLGEDSEKESGRKLKRRGTERLEGTTTEKVYIRIGREERNG